MIFLKLTQLICRSIFKASWSLQRKGASKNLRVQDWQKAVCLHFSQASSGIRMDQNKGFLPVLYSKVFGCKVICGGLYVICFKESHFRSNVENWELKTSCRQTNRQTDRHRLPIGHQSQKLLVDFASIRESAWKKCSTVMEMYQYSDELFQITP